MASKKESKKVKLLIIIGGLVLLILILIPILVPKFYIDHRPFQMSGVSMTPTYRDGARLFTNTYSSNTVLKRTDIIVFKAPPDPQKDYIKRIIALPGDNILLKNGKVYLNGQLLDEPYTNGTQTYPGSFLAEGQTINIPQGQYFVMGDNRPESSDSREWGFVPAGNILNIATRCYQNCK